MNRTICHAKIVPNRQINSKHSEHTERDNGPQNPSKHGVNQHDDRTSNSHVDSNHCSTRISLFGEQETRENKRNHLSVTQPLLADLELDGHLYSSVVSRQRAERGVDFSPRGVD